MRIFDEKSINGSLNPHKNRQGSRCYGRCGKNHGHTVVPTRRLEVTTDPADNIFLECADAARADYLVTGNQKHLPRFWKKTKVVTAREFVSLAAPHLVKHLIAARRE
jgi:predicted nucleic acid-binding protein